MIPTPASRHLPPIRALRFLPALLALLTLFVAPSAPAATDLWQPVGPEGGSITSLARASARPELVYAGAFPGGLSRSTDGGVSWTSLLDRLPVPRIRLVATGADGDTVVVVASDHGIWSSRDGGDTWAPGGLPVRSPYVTALAVAAADPDRVYAAGRGAWRSDTGGVTWSPIHPVDEDDLLLDLAVHPDDPDTVWAVLFENAVLRSRDGGASWQPLPVTGDGFDFPDEVAIDPTDPSTVYVAGSDGLRVSRDGGSSWSDPMLDSIEAVVPDPSMPGTAFAIQRVPVAPSQFDDHLHRVSDGGVTSLLYVFDSPLRSLAPGTAGLPPLCSIRYEGVRLGSADGTAWSLSNAGLRTTDVTAFDLVPAQPSTVHATGRTSAYLLLGSRDGAASWASQRPREGSLAIPARQILAHPDDPEIFYVLLLDAVARFDTGPGVRRSLLPKTLHWSLALDPRSPERLYAVTEDPEPRGPHHLFASSDAGDTWTELPLPGGDVRGGWDVAVDPTDGDVLYVAAGSTTSPGGAVLRSSDRGSTWTVTGLGVLPPVARVVAQPGASGTRLFAVGFSSPLYVSEDGGNTWRRDFGLSPGAAVTSVAVAPHADGPVVVGTNGAGVFRSDGDGSWRPVGEGLPALRVEQVRFLPGTDVVLARLRNGGLWRIGVPRACPPDDARLLCLGDAGRFRVEVGWRTTPGGAGRGTAGALDPAVAANAWGWLWFFSPDNAELAVKLLDGRPVNGHWWLFYASMTDVAFDLLVTDTERGAVRAYRNPHGRLASRGDTVAFRAPPDAVPAAAGAVPLPTATGAGLTCGGGAGALCLRQGRFRVEATWTDFADGEGDATGVALARDSGYLWFFRAANPEIFVKVLDGRPVNGRWWVFYGALSNVGFEITVTDTVSGAAKTYRNPVGRFASVADTAALP